MRVLLKNISLFLIVVTLFLSALELVFRIARQDDALKLSMGRVDFKYRHALQPNSELHLVSSVAGEYDVTAHINNHGFRGPDFELEKRAGEKRIFMVGDSFTFGVGAREHETIPAFLQSMIDSSREQVQVVNAGRGHYSPLTYYLWIRDEILELKPDLIVMMLDFSDLWEDWDHEKNLVYDAQGHMAGLSPYYEYGKFQWWNFLRSKSVFCSYIHNKIIRTAQKIKKLGFQSYLKAKIRGTRAKAIIATQEKDTIAFDGRLFMRGQTKADEIKMHFERTAKYILMSYRLAQDHGVKFVLVMYPYGIYVGADQWDEGRVFWGFEKGKVYKDLFAFELVESFTKEHEIPFINLLDDFIKHKDKKLFFAYDGHFTPAANQVTAEALAQHPVFQEALERL